ncbi:MAG: hypothetical protein WCI51_12590 [Lentisphaerota bacterium]
MSEQKYYALGAFWDDQNPQDQTERFIHDGIWQNGYDDKFVNIVNNVEAGARVAIKSKFTRGEGRKISVTRIKAIGTVVDNERNGKDLKVEWDKNFNEFELDGGGYLWAISRVKKKDKINKIFFHGKTPNIEKRISRLTWNTNGWIFPSGREGKSTNKDLYEAQFGYGHEEWLLDTGKLIDGYHYGFLEPIKQQQDAYLIDRVYDVWLYTIGGESKKHYWVGEIKKLEVLNETEAEKAYNFYKGNNWLNEMGQQIIATGAEAGNFTSSKNLYIFNVRFRPQDLVFNDPIIELPQDHPVVKQTRYVFAHFKDEFELNNKVKKTFPFIASSDADEDLEQPLAKKYHREAKAVEIIYLHKAICNDLTKHLKEEYGRKNVRKEHPDSIGGRIDVVVNSKGGFIFYEIKTYNSLKASIREAIGQLMEYSLWPDSTRAKELIIVTQPLGDIEEAKVYVKHLRDTYQLPIYYQSFDLEGKILSPKY